MPRVDDIAYAVFERYQEVERRVEDVNARRHPFLYARLRFTSRYLLDWYLELQDVER